MLGNFGSTAIARTSVLLMPWLIADHWVPPSSVLNTPSAVAAYTVPRFRGSIATARIMPPPGSWRVHGCFGAGGGVGMKYIQ